jgi:hypothetical protein
MSMSDVQIMRSFIRKLAAVPAQDVGEEPYADEKGPNAPMIRAQNTKVKLEPRKKPGMLESLQGSLPAMPDLSKLNYGSMAGGMAGGIGAGLGARGLANMFRSKEDEEEGKTPWWANAAGVGAGVGGAVLGANYLPQLLSMLTAQGGGDKGGINYNQAAASDIVPPQITAPKNPSAPATSAYPRS